MIYFVPRSKHTPLLLVNQLTLYREIIAVSSEIPTKYINALCGQKVIFFNAKPGHI